MSGTFTIEYAKSNRSTCKKCKDKIAQGALRIGKMGQRTLIAPHPAPITHQAVASRLPSAHQQPASLSQPQCLHHSSPSTAD